jgi:cellulose synthase/poly-beta-1,6-N-acetylglucosamine synthase-like glycosyltransferase
MYFKNAMNLYKKTRFYSGKRKVIGTPYVFLRKALVEVGGYDPKMTHSDDSDLCNRLAEKGYTVGIADCYVWEIGRCSFDVIVERWDRYGISDNEFYKKYSKKWNMKRKLFSLLHPIHADCFQPLKSNRINCLNKIYLMPFLFLITLLRYLFWFKANRSATI